MNAGTRTFPDNGDWDGPRGRAEASSKILSPLASRAQLKDHEITKAGIWRIFSTRGTTRRNAAVLFWSRPARQFFSNSATAVPDPFFSRVGDGGYYFGPAVLVNDGIGTFLHVICSSSDETYPPCRCKGKAHKHGNKRPILTQPEWPLRRSPQAATLEE